MKATYKQHEGFQHLSKHFINNYQNTRVQNIEDTSNKKYPNNKYYQFDNEDSSGRKYLRQKLNLNEDDYQQHDHEQRYQQSIQTGETHKNNNKSMKSQLYNSLLQDLQNKYHRPKNSSKYNKSTKVRSTNKSSSQPNYKTKKSSTHISTIQSKCQTKNVIKSSRNFMEQTEGQLKHYKKLCLDMRKKNTQLTKQLNQCKQQNRKSLNELQRKVQKISKKYTQKQENKENMDNNKTEKIMESLKTIKGKLNKKQSQQFKQYRKFYQFFTQSLGILEQESNEAKNKYTLLEAQIIWKHILQFLITHQYKMETSSKVKTIR